MPATVLCRLCSRTAGQQFTELYDYVIRSTDVHERYPISPENLGNLSMRSQCVPGPLSSALGGGAWVRGYIYYCFHFCYVRSLPILLEVYQVLAGTANFSLLFSMLRKRATRPPCIDIP